MPDKPQRRQQARPGPKPGTGLDAVYLRRGLSDLRRELDPWRQGCLVPGLQLFWAAPDGLDPLTGVEVGYAPEGLWQVVAWDGVRALPDDGAEDPDAPAARDSTWGVITSQTCDVMGVGPGAQHPTVQVSPLRLLSGAHDPGEIARINRHETIDYHPVTAPPAEGEWAVDLRISLPVSKAVLLGQEPRSAFKTSLQEHEFGERVAAKSRRPSLHDEISNTFVNRLRELVKQEKAAGTDWPERVEQFRFLVHDGDRLQPKRAGLVVVLSEPLLAEDRQPLRLVVNQEKKRLLGHDITLTGANFYELSKLGAEMYRRSEPLYVPELGHGAYW